jgi:phosphonate transport system substrate-binding protein
MPNVAAFLAALLIAISPVAFAGEILRFAPLPMESPETVASQWKPLLGHLEKSLGVTLHIDYSTDYQEILDKFATGRLDLAYLGPLPYLRLKDRFPAAQPLVIFREKNGKSVYTCALIAPAESELRTGQLKGRKIALTQPLSTCGYFSVEGLLQQAGSSLQDNHFRYLGQHDEVALAVARGEFSAGGLKTDIARKYDRLGLVILAETAPLPGLALVANGDTLSPERIAQIRQVLLDADPTVRKYWGDNIRSGVIPARDEDYAGVRQLPYKANIPERSNF